MEKLNRLLPKKMQEKILHLADRQAKRGSGQIKEEGGEEQEKQKEKRRRINLSPLDGIIRDDHWERVVEIG